MLTFDIDQGNELVFCDRHERIQLAISFMRTLRVPDDGRSYPLPAGMGPLPIRWVADYRNRVPAHWLDAPGVMIPLHAREAVWLGFTAMPIRPHAIKIGTGWINAVSGHPWNRALTAVQQPSWLQRLLGRRPHQDYVVCPPQLWLDGFNTGHGTIRQFVATPLGSGHTVEGQVTGQERYGGIQILVYPPKPGRFAAGPSSWIRKSPQPQPQPQSQSQPQSTGDPAAEIAAQTMPDMVPTPRHDRPMPVDAVHASPPTTIPEPPVGRDQNVPPAQTGTEVAPDRAASGREPDTLLGYPAPTTAARPGSNVPATPRSSAEPQPVSEVSERTPVMPGLHPPLPWAPAEQSAPAAPAPPSRPRYPAPSGAPAGPAAPPTPAELASGSVAPPRLAGRPASPASSEAAAPPEALVAPALPVPRPAAPPAPAGRPASTPPPATADAPPAPAPAGIVAPQAQSNMSPRQASGAAQVAMRSSAQAPARLRTAPITSVYAEAPLSGREPALVRESLGIAAGGQISQNLFPDPYGIDTWDETAVSEVRVYLVPSETWLHLTGEEAPPLAASPRLYAAIGYPWFAHYEQQMGDIQPSPALQRIKPIK